MHCVAQGFPVSPTEFDQSNSLPLGTTEERYTQFFMSVGNTLPCKYCRESYRTFVSENPIRATSRVELTKWLWEIHNMVNQKLGVQYPNSDFESIYNKYESFRARCGGKLSKGCILPRGASKPRCVVITTFDDTRSQKFRKAVCFSMVCLIIVYILLPRDNLRELIN